MSITKTEIQRKSVFDLLVYPMAHVIGKSMLRPISKAESPGLKRFKFILIFRGAVLLRKCGVKILTFVLKIVFVCAV